MFLKRFIYTLGLLVLLTSCKREPFVPNYTNGLPGLWKQLADFPGAGRVRAYGFSVGGKGYIVGGNAGAGFNLVPLYDLWEYDPATDKWTRKADYPGQAAEYLRGFTINGKAYIGTGFGIREYTPNAPTQNKDFWEYDPAADKWTRKADFPGTERENVVAFQINNQGYLGLGTNNSYDVGYKDIWRYDPALNSWTRIADYPGNGTFGNAALTSNGKAYVGLGGTAPDIIKNDFWQYDPAANKWIAIADFPGRARVFSSQFIIDDEGYIGFGTTTQGTASDWYKYNAATNAWTKITTFMGVERYDAVAFSINGIGYTGTGNPGLQKDFWKYTPNRKQ